VTPPPTPPMKPGDTRIVNGVTYACVRLSRDTAGRRRFRAVLEALPAANGDGVCCQCPYRGTSYCLPEPSACSSPGDNAVIVRLDSLPILALEGVLL
jgi:hypothetical protein